jgi:histidyl-tRNA synthetase
VLEGLADALGFPSSKHLAIFRIIDKLDKIGSESVKEELRRALNDVKESAEKIAKLLMIVEKRGKAVENEEVKKILNGTAGKKGLEELEQIVEKAENYGFSKHIFVDFSLARGLDYYTGPVFEVTVEKYKDVGSVAGGGRYEKLIELYGGKMTPATGISLGIDRLVNLMETENLFTLPKTSTKVFVAPVNEEMSGRAIEIAQMLRKNEIPTEVDVMGRKLSEQLKYADKKEIPYAVIVGKNDVKTGFVVLRDMGKKEQRKVKIPVLPSSLLSLFT